MKIMLLGLGRANFSVAQYVIKRGDTVFLYEDNPAALSIPAQEMLREGAVQFYGGESCDLAVTSPGFPMEKPIIKDLQARSIKIIDEIEFTFQNLERPNIIAVTGTNGKSTTVALISSILTSAGIRNFLGGNISPGTPFSRTLHMPPFDYYVLEVSSFQLMRIEQFKPHVAVITNISIDHLNWHKDYTEYKQAKLRIFMNQKQQDYAVLNNEDEGLRECADIVKSNVVYFGSETKTGAWVDGYYWYKNEKLCEVGKSRLKGAHNVLNILAAVAVAKCIGLSSSDIEKGLTTFSTLPHRLEEIGTYQGIKYINNSMCTNTRAAIESFKAIKGYKIVIVGGKQKGDKGIPYLELLVNHAKACVVLGANAEYIADYFRTKDFNRFVVAGDIRDAVKKARTFARPGDIIFLNPGYASFDHFTNFEERGDAFKDAAKQN